MSQMVVGVALLVAAGLCLVIARTDPDTPHVTRLLFTVGLALALIGTGLAFVLAHWWA